MVYCSVILILCSLVTYNGKTGEPLSWQPLLPHMVLKYRFFFFKIFLDPHSFRESNGVAEIFFTYKRGKGVTYLFFPRVAIWFAHCGNCLFLDIHKFTEKFCYYKIQIGSDDLPFRSAFKNVIFNRSWTLNVETPLGVIQNKLDEEGNWM